MIAWQTGQNANFVARLRIGRERDCGFDLIVNRKIDGRAVDKVAGSNFLCVGIRGIFSLERDPIRHLPRHAGKKGRRTAKPTRRFDAPPSAGIARVAGVKAAGNSAKRIVKTIM